MSVDHLSGRSGRAGTFSDRDVKPVRVMLLISSLEYGGAERQVIELYRHLDRRQFEPVICSLSRTVPLAEDLSVPRRDLDVVNKSWKYDFTTIGRVAAIMRQRGIAIVHAFLFDAEIVARASARLARVRAVVSSERNSDYTRSWVQGLCLRATRSWSNVLIANSNAGKRLVMQTHGHHEQQIHVIHNGVDVDYFRPVDSRDVRVEFGIPQDELVVGMVASFKRQKRHRDFFAMAKGVLDRMPNVRFVCVGEPLRDNQQGANDYHQEMLTLVNSLGVAERVQFVGTRSDMPAVYGMCALTVLSSEREGTPNVLLESMACQVPVIATDVADNAALVRNEQTGFVIPVGDTRLMIDKVCQLLTDRGRRDEMGRAGREWVSREFSVQMLAKRTAEVYQSALCLTRSRSL